MLEGAHRQIKDYSRVVSTLSQQGFTCSNGVSSRSIQPHSKATCIHTFVSSYTACWLSSSDVEATKGII